MSILDPGKLAVISIIAMIVLGPQRLGQVARQCGALWRTVSEQRARLETEIHRTLDGLDPPDPHTAGPAGSFHRAFEELRRTLPGAGCEPSGGEVARDPSALRGSVGDDRGEIAPRPGHAPVDRASLN